MRVQRKIGVHLSPEEQDRLFQFSYVRNPDGTITQAYRNLVYDRAVQVALSLAGSSQRGLLVQAVTEQSRDDSAADEILVHWQKKLFPLIKLLAKGP